MSKKHKKTAAAHPFHQRKRLRRASVSKTQEDIFCNDE
jgi:hypothetical protein